MARLWIRSEKLLPTMEPWYDADRALCWAGDNFSATGDGRILVPTLRRGSMFKNGASSLGLMMSNLAAVLMSAKSAFVLKVERGNEIGILLAACPWDFEGEMSEGSPQQLAHDFASSLFAEDLMEQ